MAPSRGQSAGVLRLQALEPCKRYRVSQPLDLAQWLRAGDKCGPSGTHTDHFQYHDFSACPSGLAVGFPVGLSLGATPSGLPDLRIELVRLHWGYTGGAPRDRCRGPSHRAPPGRPSNPGSSRTDTTAGIAGGAGGAPSSWSSCDSQQSQPFAQRLSTAGAVLLFSVLHPSAAAALGPCLLLPGLAVAAADVAVLVLGRAAHDPVSERVRQPIPSGERPPVSSAGSGAEGAAPLAGRVRRRLGSLVGRLDRVPGPAAELLQRIMVPSALLSLAGKAWRAVHASSAALAEAVVELVAVGLSYSHLAREAQLGGLAPGRSQELAWRRLHKAAAQRLARHLTDLPAQPPLAPALAALQRCSIAAGLAVDGVPLCGAMDSLAACGGGGGGGGDARQLLVSLSYGCGRRRRADQPANDHLSSSGVAAVTTAPSWAGGVGGAVGSPCVPVSVVAGTMPTDAAATPPPPPPPPRRSAHPCAEGSHPPIMSLHQLPTRPPPAPPPPQPTGSKASGPGLAQPNQATHSRPSMSSVSSSVAGTIAGITSSPTSCDDTAASSLGAAQQGGPRAASPSSLHLTVTAPLSRGSSGTTSSTSGAVAPQPATAAAAGGQGRVASPGTASTALAACTCGPAGGHGVCCCPAASVHATAADGGRGDGPGGPSHQPAAAAAAAVAGGEQVQPPLPRLRLRAPQQLQQQQPRLPQQPHDQPQQQQPHQQLQLPAVSPRLQATGAFGAGGTWELRNHSRGQAARLLRQEQAQAEALGLPLYGRADHARLSELDRPTGLRARLDLAGRAVYLVAIFAPFLTLGVTLLLLSALLNPKTVNPNPSSTPPSTSATGHHPFDVNTDTSDALHSTSRDTDHHTSGPGSGSSGCWRSRVAQGCRRRCWQLLLGGCRRGGAAFIKWGQWSATRVDLFPDDFCEALSQLHDQAPTHSFAFTRRQVERSFGVPLDLMFEAFDRRPVASGSIAQVHRALMRCSDGSPLDVAVKVVHPRVELRIRQDFALLRPAAAALGRLRSLRSLSLPETVSQFSCTMTAQADLRVEAAHLRRFYTNFSHVSSQVTTPRPLPGLVRQEVMVETWEPGRSVAHFIRHPGPLNTAVVCLGVDTYLKMLLQDNFVHTDLHPGNIMVRMVSPGGRQVPLPQDPGPASRSLTHPAFASPRDATNGFRSDRTVSPAPGPDPAASVQLVLLDFGLAEELTPVVRHHFISFLHHLMRGDGYSAAAHLLRWTSRAQACSDPAAFTTDMVALSAARCDVHSAAGVDLDAVMKDVLRLARKHTVTIDSCYASLVIAVCVIVGFATSLDPGVNLVDAAVPAMLAHALTGRVVGRLYS